MFYFLNGIPRSGSTLLANILAQNPRFHTTSTSGCLDVLFNVRNMWDSLSEHQSAGGLQDVKLNVLKGILNSYYSHVTRPVIIDKSRGWVAYMEMMQLLLGYTPKIIVTTRKPVDVLASFEKLYRKTSSISQPELEKTNYFVAQTTTSRCEALLNIDSPFGLCLYRIEDAINRGFGKYIHFVPYEDLISEPSNTLLLLYQFLEEEPYTHDFNNIEPYTHEDDYVYGMSNSGIMYNSIINKPSDAKIVLGNCYAKYAQLQYPWIEI